jgi:phosphoribosylformylglycinamidine synthase
MKNESMMGGIKICVPPTLLISALGQIDDVHQAVTLDFKQPGDVVFLLGETGEHTGGSEYFRYLGKREGLAAELGQPAPFVGNRPPTVDPAATLPLYERFHEALRDGLIRSAATPAKGGLAVAFARSALGGLLGAEIDLDGCGSIDGLDPDIALFSESNGRFVVTVAGVDAGAFRERLDGLPCWRVGRVSADPRLVIRRKDQLFVDAGLARLRQRFQEGLGNA